MTLPVAWSQQRSGVTELRVAPTQQQGSAVKIDRIELNSWPELVLEMQLVAFRILLLCALLAIEAVLWRRTLRQPAEGTQLSRRDKVGWIVPAAVQWGLKAALLTVKIGFLGIAAAIGAGLLCTVIQHYRVPVLRGKSAAPAELADGAEPGGAFRLRAAAAAHGSAPLALGTDGTAAALGSMPVFGDRADEYGEF